MDRTEQAMRFLTAMALSRPGNKIRVLRESLDKVGPQHQLECFTDGAFVEIRVSVNEAKDVSSER